MSRKKNFLLGVVFILIVLPYLLTSLELRINQAIKSEPVFSYELENDNNGDQPIKGKFYKNLQNFYDKGF